VLVTGFGNRPDSLIWVELAVTDPCHPKTADLDEDPAD
jgi:hypothetical protein